MNTLFFILTRRVKCHERSCFGLIADQSDRARGTRTRRPSRKCTYCKYSACTSIHRPHVHLETSREAKRNCGGAVAAVAHAPPDSGRRGMVYLPGAINVADIMDSGLSYGPIFLRNYSTLLRNGRDSIAERSPGIRALTSHHRLPPGSSGHPPFAPRPNLDPVFYYHPRT